MTNQTDDMASEKGTIRSRLLRARREHAPSVRAGWSGEACARLLDLTADADVVAAYSSFGTEPDTAPLLAGLLQRGIRVLLPVLLKDGDLAWGWYSGPDSLVRGTGGIDEPAVAADVEEILRADFVVVPGLAVDSRGMRLGRGGGSYDRVLGRIESAHQGEESRLRTVALLYPDEVGADIPAEAHDRPVDAAVTAAGLTRFR
jgi:5-formyltetrahydrofolate cyclo-ligase